MTGPKKGSRPGEADCPEEPGKCNAWMPRHGRRCRNNAGQWTDHPGHGNCKMHTGNTRPANIEHYRLEAIEYATSLAAEKSMNPVEAMLWCIRLSAGAVSYWYGVISTLPEGTPVDLALAIEEAYGKERDRLAKTSQAALGMNLADRMAKLAEKQTDIMLLILEETFEQYGIPAKKLAEAKAYALGVAQTIVAGR